MKTKTFLTIFVALFFVLVPSAWGSVVISEVALDGGTGHANNEFIRLRNAGDSPVALTGCKITQEKFSAKNSSCTEETLVPASKFDGTSIPAGGMFLIAHPEYEGSDTVDVSYAKSNTLTGNTMKVSLLDAHGTTLAVHNLGTKCETPPPIDPPKPEEVSGEPSVRLNEIFPNPSAKGDTGEFIELYNFGDTSANLSSWSLRDATKTGKYTFPPSTALAAGAYLFVTDQDFKLSLNNSNETISLLDAKDTLIDSAHYKTSKDDVSLNYTPSGWRGGTPTPGTPNILNNLPSIKERVPKRGYHGVPIVMSAKGKDADGDKLKYTWDFGDGHKSYKKETKHTYEKNGTYTVTLTTGDGHEDILETFTIKIHSYKPPEIRITSLMPNPSGKDTEQEWIAIANREKKEVNLKGFSIATGSKKLINHPIREDFILSPKQEAKLTHTQAAFTLPNQKGKIELRAPDGKSLQKIAYKLEKSAPENAVYRKKKGERWQFEAGEKTNVPQSAPDRTEETALSENTEPETIDAWPSAETIIQPSEAAVLGVTDTALPPGRISGPLSEEPHQPKPSDIINYGTRMHLPENIEYTPHDPFVPLSRATEAEPNHAPTDILTEINATVNTWLNQESD